MNLNKDTAVSIASPDICKHCRVLINNQSKYDSKFEKKCEDWLEKCSSNDTNSSSEFDSETSSSQLENEEENGQLTFDESMINISDLNQIHSRFGKVQITNSKNPHVGNVTIINGPVYINETKSIVNQQNVTNQTFFPQAQPRKLFIVERKNWLAQPSLGVKEHFDKIPKYIVICHTATEEGLNQYDNVHLIRTIQGYHIESRKWQDIAYNFLIGCDGNVYEGRGWNVIGSHTFGYNDIALGIAFVGCFTTKLPTKIALEQAKSFIQYGVQIGALDPKYRIVCHCQCRPFESPGRLLYEEIKTWDNWYDLENLQAT